MNSSGALTRRWQVATPMEMVTGMSVSSNLKLRLLDELADLLGELTRVGVVDLGQDDGELLAAVARQDVLAADAALDHRRRGA